MFVQQNATLALTQQKFRFVLVLSSWFCFLLYSCAEYLVIVSVALSMNGAQLVGFVKCSRDAKRKLGDVAGTVAGSAFATMARGAAGRLTSRFAPSTTYAPVSPTRQQTGSQQDTIDYV